MSIANGIIFQWGNIYISGQQTITITLPTSFASTNYKPIICMVGTGDVNYMATVRDGSLTRSTFKITGNGDNVNWMAIGY